MNVGWTQVTFASGPTATGTWRHPDQVTRGIANADVIELDDVPVKIDPECVSHNQTNVGTVMWTQTKNGVTGVSSHLQDTSTWRIWATVKVPSPMYQGQR